MQIFEKCKASIVLFAYSVCKWFINLAKQSYLGLAYFNYFILDYH